MSNRSTVEFNHDYCPGDSDEELLAWAYKLRAYLQSGIKGYLPDGVTFICMRHHSDESVVEEVVRLTGLEQHVLRVFGTVDLDLLDLAIANSKTR